MVCLVTLSNIVVSSVSAVAPGTEVRIMSASYGKSISLKSNMTDYVGDLKKCANFHAIDWIMAPTHT
jgi:hypothetical protein